MIKKIVVVTLLVSTSLTAFAEQRNPPLTVPAHKEILNALNQSAQAQADKNLNRFALERLYRYNTALDSLYSKEKADTLAAIEQVYLTSTAVKQSQRKNSSERIVTLTAEKEELEKLYHKLLRKSGLAFLVWLIIVLFMLQFRKKKLKSSEVLSGNSDIRMNALEARNAIAEVTLNEAKNLESTLERIVPAVQKIYSIASTKAADVGSSAIWNNEILPLAEKTQLTALKEKEIVNALLSQETDWSEEKTDTDINRLCEIYLDIAQRGFTSLYPDLNCQVSRDFEKRLPVIKVVPSAVGNLLLNVFLNAFQSVQEKSAQPIKGYVPKVAVSTRILPRFLQIRIRDTGTGMNDETLKKATEEFFSTKGHDVAVGLGLSESSRIISTLHNGEIKIETEKGNSTDVYIKFFL